MAILNHDGHWKIYMYLHFAEIRVGVHSIDI